MSHTHNIWQQALAALELEIDPAIISTWFRNTQLFETTEDRIVIACTDAYSKNVIQKKYSTVIEKIIQSHQKKKIKLEFIVKPKTTTSVLSGPLFDAPPELTAKSQSTPENLSQVSPSIRNLLNRNYNLENFVVGVSNRVVHAAAISVTENPGQIYNPLFIYGSTGVGKTHLLHAIGNSILERNPNFRIVYTSTEKFVNELIEHIRQKKPMENFRKLYRYCQLLLIDDIQFLSGKESSQEEFYHTFNELQQGGSQIVLASDREPMQIPNLADRLVSRFRGGLMVMVSPPDYETRLAIVSTKAQELGLDLTMSMIQYIAEKTGQNIREIHGAMLQIKSQSLTQNSMITFELIRSVIDPQAVELAPAKKLSPEVIFDLVTQNFETTIKDLCGKKRKKEFVIPRQMMMFLLRNELGMNYEEIGSVLGGRDHTTIMHGCEKIRSEIEDKSNLFLKSQLNFIRQELYR